MRPKLSLNLRVMTGCFSLGIDCVSPRACRLTHVLNRFNIVRYTPGRPQRKIISSFKISASLLSKFSHTNHWYHCNISPLFPYTPSRLLLSSWCIFWAKNGSLHSDKSKLNFIQSNRLNLEFPHIDTNVSNQISNDERGKYNECSSQYTCNDGLPHCVEHAKSIKIWLKWLTNWTIYFLYL